MNLFAYLYRGSYSLFVLSVLSGLIGGLSGAGLIALVTKGFNAAERPLSLIIFFFVVGATHVVSKTYSSVALAQLAQTAILRLRLDLSRSLLGTPLEKLHALGKHGILANLTKDVDSLMQALQSVPNLLVNAATLVACLGYIAWLSWQLFAFLCGCVVIGMLAYSVAERLPLRHLVEVRTQIDHLYRHMRDLVEGSKELQLNRQRGTFFIDHVIAPSARAFKQSYVRAVGGYAWVVNISTSLFFVVLGVLLFVVPHWFPASVGDLTGIAFIVLYLVMPITEIMLFFPMIREGGIALGRIEQLGGELGTPQVQSLAPDPFVASTPLKLELSNLYYAHPGSMGDTPFRLGPINLQLNQGEILFLLGGNGCGKTTLAMLILGLYQPEAGTIVLNGVSVDIKNREHYRQYFSAVFYDFHLFEQLLSHNHQAFNGQADECLSMLGLSHKVKIVDGKFSTIDLSAGQRKRLALVSAYLEDRPIYLFDEWAADQDAMYRRLFYTKLLPDLKSRGKTVVVITHDEAYFSFADRIVKLDKEVLLHTPIGQPETIHNSLSQAFLL